MYLYLIINWITMLTVAVVGAVHGRGRVSKHAELQRLNNGGEYVKNLLSNFAV